MKEDADQLGQDLAAHFSRVMRLCEFCKRFIVPKIESFKKNKACLQKVLHELTTADPLINLTRPKSLSPGYRHKSTVDFPPLLEIESKRLMNQYLSSLPQNEVAGPAGIDPLATLRESMRNWIARLQILADQKKIEPDAEREVMDIIRKAMN